jgi:hypothetical protein
MARTQCFTRTIRLIALISSGLAACGDGATSVAPGDEVKSVQLTGVPLEAGIGDTLHLSAVITARSNQIVVPSTPAIEWTSAVPGAVRFRITGASTADAYLERAGATEIRATYLAKAASATVQVFDSTVLAFAVDSVIVTHATQPLPLQIAMNGRAVSIQYHVEETRAVATWPVLKAGTTSRFAPDGPGRAIIIATAPRSRPDTLRVIVDYATGAVHRLSTSSARVGNGDTVWLSGYRLDRLPIDSIRVNGAPAQVLAVTPASIALRIATITGCSASTRATVTIGGAAPVSFQVQRKHAAETDLALFAFRNVTAADPCIRLPAPQPGDTAMYALVYAHTALAASARARENPFQPYDSITLRIRNEVASDQPSAAAAERSVLDAAEPDFHITTDAFADRTTPFSVGDTIRAPMLGSSQPTLLRVSKIYGNYFAVLTKVDGPGFAHIEARFDTAMAFATERLLPFYRRVFADRMPTTGGTGQLAIALEEFSSVGAAAGGFAGLGRVEVQYAAQSSATDFVSVLGHEIGHVWHFKARELPEFRGSYERWSVEGIATFLQTEMTRQYLGIALDANLPAFTIGHPQALYTNKSLIDGNWFFSGYAHAASYFRDLVWVLMTERGMSHEEAFGIVLRGAAKGWYGCSAAGCAPEGLAEVMTELVGPNWSVGESLLDWTTATIIDDVTPSTRYQMPAFANRTLMRGPDVLYYAYGSLATGQRSLETKIVNGATGFIGVRVGDDGAGIVIEPAADVVWRVIRLR